MGKYIDWDDIVIRYPAIDNVGGASEIGSAWLGAVENQVEGMLATAYTVPFSNNNETMKDLCIELAYLRIGNLKIDESKTLKENFMERIKRLTSGGEAMIDSSGEVIGRVGDTIYSTTSGYKPIFDLGEVEKWETDPNQVSDINDGKE